MVVGTPHYAQPEQLTTRELKPASDTYSLGMILYELLTARSPFHGDKPLVEVKEEYRSNPLLWLRAHAQFPVIPLDQRPGGEALPPALVQGVTRTLSKNPDERPPDAGALANLLGLVLHRDLGVPVAGDLRILHPDQTLEDRLFLPGSYRLGTGERCEIKLRADDILKVHAILDWSGLPNSPQLRPVTGNGSVRVNDQPIQKPVDLGPDDEFSIGSYRFAISFAQ
jgi:serine/threonine-protein kinase